MCPIWQHIEMAFSGGWGRVSKLPTHTQISGEHGEHGGRGGQFDRGLFNQLVVFQFVGRIFFMQSRILKLIRFLQYPDLMNNLNQSFIETR